MVVGKIVGEIVRRGATVVVPTLFRQFRQRDVAIHSSLFGKAGGRGWRHGRDAGLYAGGALGKEKDDLDGPNQYRYTSRKFPKTYRGRGNFGRGRRYNKYATACKVCAKSKSRRYNRS